MEAEIKTGGVEGNENAAERSSGSTVEATTEEGKVDLGRILDDSPLESVVKPVVEEFSRAAESLVQNVIDDQSSSSSFVTQLEKEVKHLALVSDPWASLKTLDPVQESLIKGTEETLPASDKNDGESSEAVKSTSAETEKADLDENPRTTHTQPFVAVTAATRASWTNCCGLLDVVRPSNQ